MDKKRLDLYLVEHSFINSRNRAKNFIEGERDVFVNGKKVTKPSFLVSEEDKIELIKKHQNEFVSRAGYKLEKGLEHWKLNLDDLSCLDIGASTGGFTQCCLLNGASKVIAIDVGKDQLMEDLKKDSRVISKEETNFRYITTKEITDKIDFFCCDVSFISLEYIIKPLAKLNLAKEAFGILLIKPQFESNLEDIKNGRAMTKKIHFRAIKKVMQLAIDNNFLINDLTFSPITGNKKHNIEYLILLSTFQKKVNNNISMSDNYINKVIDEAWLSIK